MNKKDLIDALHQKEYEDYVIDKTSPWIDRETFVMCITLFLLLLQKTGFIVSICIAVATYFITTNYLWYIRPAAVILSVLFSLMWAVITIFLCSFIPELFRFLIGFIVLFAFLRLHRKWIRLMT